MTISFGIFQLNLTHIAVISRPESTRINTKIGQKILLETIQNRYGFTTKL